MAAPTKKLAIAAVLLVAAAVGWYVLKSTQAPGSDVIVKRLPSDPLNATYVIDGTPTTLVNGMAETEAAPGSAIKDVTKAFGIPTRGDLDGDGLEDATIILVDQPGGTGTFFYVVAAINTGSGYLGTNAIFLGDRIAPQTLEIRKGEIIANYADRKPGEPFSARPSVGVSKYLVMEGRALTEKR